jgi:hypothetical protein
MKTPHHIPNFRAGAIRPFFLVGASGFERLSALSGKFTFRALSSPRLLLYASTLAAGERFPPGDDKADPR